MELTATPSAHSRVRGNELAKGYYPTFPKDVEKILEVLDPAFGWKSRNQSDKVISILDPCAGEGAFLSTVSGEIKNDYKKAFSPANHDILSYAVELDQSRCDKIRRVACKINASFFDVDIVGKFSLILLNPPYNRNAPELLQWMQKCTPRLSYRGVMVLIIPEYELKGAMVEYLKGSFKFHYVYKSEEHDRFKQIIVFLSNALSNTTSRTWGWPGSNLEEGERTKISEQEQARTLCVEGTAVEQKPFLSQRDRAELYASCEDRLQKAIEVDFSRVYPSNYDTSIQPLATLRTAHAVQLAAMNSQIESVKINDEHFLAKFMVTNKVESFKDPDSNTETCIHKPSVEAFLMNAQGEVKPAKEYGFDYYELNSALSGVLLQKLSKLYKPLHEIGQDEEFLADELKEIGLKPPQREAVKAAIKAFNSGRKGVGIRANTGTGKTWMAKAVKYLLGAKKTVMVSEPQLIPQLAKEYADEGFDVHVIDSWESMKELSRTQPAGLYLIAYTRLRMHPKYEIVIPERKTLVKKDGQTTKEFVQYCASCRTPLYEKVRRGDKPKCPICDAPFYSYVAENDKDKRLMSFRRWIRQIEDTGTATAVISHNKQLPYIRELKKIKFDLAIFDECHNASNLMSNQGTAFIRLAASSKKVLALTATLSNGMAKSLYNILWGVNPRQMMAEGWDRKSATDYQTRYGAFKEVKKTEENNRHRGSERVTTYDTAGISPAALIYTLPNFVNVDSDDFDDLPPVEREVINCQPHQDVERAFQAIQKIIDDAKLDLPDKLAAASVRNAACLRASDTLRHFDDELRLRDVPLGTLHRYPINELLEKEQELIRIAQFCTDQGERLLVYTGNTQKLDMRPVIRRLLEKHLPGVSIEVLPDSVSPQKLMNWFEKVTAQVVIASFHRVATGLNLSQFNNLVWYDYTDHTRLAEQGEGRVRRVNTADIHRKVFGEVRPVRYWYLTSSELQAMQLSYTLEKRMVAKLAEGETPDIDPSECSGGNQSFSALITNALHKGTFDYQDPSTLLRKMMQHENAKIAHQPSTSPAAAQPAKVLTLPVAPQPSQPDTYTVIYYAGGKEVARQITADEYQELEAANALEVTLFGTYVRSNRPALKRA
ncbi:DEAD/DEAH box helicase family protein [Geoalkalibacter halelectricus]|uniref:DEAD/DEAH box helicase family protein n=1 Tax=Geoalkalibacter halelectricus TaxID=2847045 RepID=UPI0026707F32|nr:DEAD/DEAH box helicase family protein [Geoalkalibacter halelectricus]MDO3380418.1 DEAD/DEAH box helicase family protein [Geoalkalibacter halelectricus]